MAEPAGRMSETLDYVKNFDPEWYLSTYYDSIDTYVEEGNIVKFLMDTTHEFLSTGVKLGDRLLDIGTGPTIHSILSASRQVQHIDLTDFTPRNLEILRDWKAGKRDLIRQIMVYEMKLANDKRSEADREAEIRSKVDNILRIDLTNDKVFLDSNPDEQLYDVITSTLCLEAVSTSKEVYTRSVRNISKFLKPGGHLLLVGVLGQTFYRVGDHQFPCARLTSEEIRRTYRESGFNIVKYRAMFENEVPNLQENDFSDFKDVFAMLACKT